MKKSCLIISSIFYFIICTPHALEAKNIKGRFSIDNYFTKDSSSSYEYMITTARLKFDIKNAKKNNIIFHFKGSERKKSTGNDLSSKIPDHRIYTLNLEYKSILKKTDISLGRQDINDSGGSSVDGIHLKLNQDKNSYFGVFGGFKPDPYMQSFDTDFSSAGAYYGYKKKYLNMNLGIVNDMYKGETDRRFIFLRSYGKPSNILNIYNTIILDLGQDSGTIDITNLNIGVNISPLNKLRLSINYSQFKAVKLKKSMDFNLDRKVQKRVNMRIDYQLRRNLNIYTNYTLRLRAIDNKKSNMVRVGTRGKIQSLDIYYDINCMKDYYFTANNSSISFQLDRTLFGKVEGGLSLEFQKNKSDIDEETNSASVYTLYLDYSLSRKFYTSISLDYLSEKDYKTTTFFSVIGYRF